jgi:glutamate/tyrosine decarboxylase-like PLP-dependent enzyme
MTDRLAELERLALQLEPGQALRREWRNQVDIHSETFLEELKSSNAYFQNEDQGAGILDSPIDEEPEAISSVLQKLRAHVEYDGINAASGGHMGYIPGGGLYPSALADYLAAVSNKYAGIFFPAPGAVRMENMLIRWMNKLMGFPEHAAGNLTSGGSISNLIAVVTAREAKEVKAKDFHRLVVYLTDQTHHSLQKALRIAGLGEAQLRYIPMDAEYRMNPVELDSTIAEDLRKGLMPFFINASLGTTNTGTIDPIGTIQTIAEKHAIWFHVDAAYGGFFRLLPEIRNRTKGIEKADSITLDPHKSLFLPFGSGAVLIKDIQSMYKAHRYTADYLQDLEDSDGEFNSADVSPELTKHFRGMRMWLPLKLFGLKPFRAALEEKMLLAKYVRNELQQMDGFEVGPEPDLSVIIFRHVPVSGNVNTFNQSLIKSIQNDGRIFLSSTSIDGIFWIRIAVLVFRTHRRHLDLLLNIIKDKTEELKQNH